MLRVVPIMLLSAALASAPFQCSSEPNPADALEETPAEALFKLAEDFRKRGQEDAYRQTLQFLVTRYPSSHFATRAKHLLDEAARADSAKAPRKTPETKPAEDP